MLDDSRAQKEIQESLGGGDLPKNPDSMIKPFDQSGRFGTPNDKTDLLKQQELDRLEAEQKREQQKAAEEAEALRKKQDQEKAEKEEQAKKEKLEQERVEQEKKDQEKKELEEKQRLEQEERDKQQQLKKSKPETKQRKKKNSSSTKSVSEDETGSSTEKDRQVESPRKTKNTPEPEPMVTVDSDSESSEKKRKTPTQGVKDSGQSSSTGRDVGAKLGAEGTGRFEEGNKKQAVNPTPEKPVERDIPESAKKVEPTKVETKPTPPTTPTWKVLSVGASLLLFGASLWGVPASARHLSSLATSRGYADIAEGLLSNKGYALGAVPVLMCGMGLRSPKIGTLGLWLTACGSAAASYKEGNIYPGIITAVATIVGSFAYAMSGDTKTKGPEAGK